MLQFQPLARALDSVKAAEAMGAVVEEKKEVIMDTAETSGTTGTDATGDVTEALASQMSALEKKQLVEKLNRQAERDRATGMRNMFLTSAAGAQR